MSNNNKMKEAENRIKSLLSNMDKLKAQMIREEFKHTTKTQVKQAVSVV